LVSGEEDDIMNWAHVHLVSNHIPVLGTAFGLVLLVYAAARRDEGVKRVALGVFAVVALLALPVFFTGEPAEGVVENAPGISEPLIEAHESAALAALVAVELLGALALAGLIATWRGRRPLSPLVTRATVLVSLIAAGLMARTANLGGKIHHTEIRAGAVPPVEAEAEHDEGR
jgi:hypothetical protein